MNIKDKKKELLFSLEILEEDIKQLKCNMEDFKTEMIKLPDEMTEEEMQEFDKKFDLEKRLKIIKLFG